MQDLELQVPCTEEVEVDAATRAAIDRGVVEANHGRTIPLDDARKMISQWISKFDSQNRR